MMLAKNNTARDPDTELCRLSTEYTAAEQALVLLRAQRAATITRMDAEVAEAESRRNAAREALRLCIVGTKDSVPISPPAEAAAPPSVVPLFGNTSLPRAEGAAVAPQRGRISVSERRTAVVDAVVLKPGGSAKEYAEMLQARFPDVAIGTLTKDVNDCYLANLIACQRGRPVRYIALDTDENAYAPRCGGALNRAKVMEMKALWRSGKYTQGQLATMFEVSRQSVSRTVNGKSWPDVP